MIKRLLSIFMLALSFVFPALAVYAHDYPVKPYRARYSFTSPQGTNPMRIVTDGNGKMRTDTKSSAGVVSSIVDYKNNTSISLIKSQKMAVKTKLKPGSTTPQVIDKDSAEKIGAKSLGKKKILGRDCNGWEYENKVGKYKVWVDSDTGCCFESESLSKHGKFVMKIEEFNPKAPDSGMFQIPSGYKISSY